MISAVWGMVPAHAPQPWAWGAFIVFFAILAAGQCGDLHAPAKLISHSGEVAFRRPDRDAWFTASDNQPLFEHEKLRTSDSGQAVVELQNLSRVVMGPRSELTVLPPRGEKTKATLQVLRGLIYLLHRNQPGDLDVALPAGTAAIEGTEFVLEVAALSGAATFRMIDGQVQLANAYGHVTLTNGEQGTLEFNKAPQRTAMLESRNVVQWLLYYPGVLAPSELNLDGATQDELQEPLSSYGRGNLLKALALYPRQRKPKTVAETVFLAALKLSCGYPEEYRSLVSTLHQTNSNARALDLLFSTIAGDTNTNDIPVTTASEYLAFSYFQQSQHNLADALTSAQQAVRISPKFGFGWERIAELEFSFGRIGPAALALERALCYSPENAQAHALQGFLELARGHLSQADSNFVTAVKLDSRLGNAWLGRGLGRMRRGEIVAGRADIQTATSLEPNRSLLHSYLGKAFVHEAQFGRGVTNRAELRSQAFRELHRAVQIDPLDPTPRLYLALLNYDEYQTSDALKNLEQSQALNMNRAVYRSRFLLDQDQAVRSANLASIFADARMRDVSIRESSRGVSLDYANYSAHLFLAASADELRDPTRFNLRYESQWFNEHLLASLLAPPGAISLSQNLSQQEYSRLFAADRFGLTSSTEYLSTGEFRETVSQFGSWDGTSYALDLDYQNNRGVRINNELDRMEWYSRIKQRISERDSLLVLAKYQDYDSGDNFQYYDPGAARPAFHYSETQAPLFLAGWHHEWAPGIHTLFLGGRLVNEQCVRDTNTMQLIAVVNPPGFLDPTNVVPFNVDYESQFEIYSVELNQIVQRENHTDIFGARYQDGNIEAHNVFDHPPSGLEPLFVLPSVSRVDGRVRRLSAYAYHHWASLDTLMVIGGVAYDSLLYPENYRRPPVSDGESEVNRLSPKAAVIWDVSSKVRVRGAYAQGLGGVSYDESVRLEPTQLAGFSQSFRSLISESLVGSVEAPRHEILGGALDLRPWTRAWLSLQAEALRERVDRELGVFDYDAFGSPAAVPSSTLEELDYSEYNVRAVFNQVVQENWFLEGQYQFTHSSLARSLPDIAATPAFLRTTDLTADMHQLGFSPTWQSPKGFFVRGEFWEIIQRTGGSAEQPPGDDFQLLNLFAGYRLPHRRGDVTLGVINLFDQDYHFSPLSYHPEYTHKRALYTRLRLNF